MAIFGLLLALSTIAVAKPSAAANAVAQNPGLTIVISPNIVHRLSKTVILHAMDSLGSTIAAPSASSGALYSLQLSNMKFDSTSLDPESVTVQRRGPVELASAVNGFVNGTADYVLKLRLINPSLSKTYWTGSLRFVSNKAKLSLSARFGGGNSIETDSAVELPDFTISLNDKSRLGFLFKINSFFRTKISKSVQSAVVSQLRSAISPVNEKIRNFYSVIPLKYSQISKAISIDYSLLPQEMVYSSSITFNGTAVGFNLKGEAQYLNNRPKNLGNAVAEPININDIAQSFEESDVTIVANEYLFNSFAIAYNDAGNLDSVSINSRNAPTFTFNNGDSFLSWRATDRRRNGTFDVRAKLGFIYLERDRITADLEQFTYTPTSSEGASSPVLNWTFQRNIRRALQKFMIEGIPLPAIPKFQPEQISTTFRKSYVVMGMKIR